MPYPSLPGPLRELWLRPAVLGVDRKRREMKEGGGCQLLLQTKCIHIYKGTRAGCLATTFCLPNLLYPSLPIPQYTHSLGLQCPLRHSPFEAVFVHFNLICWANACSWRLTGSPGNKFVSQMALGHAEQSCPSCRAEPTPWHSQAIQCCGKKVSFQGSLSYP